MRRGHRRAHALLWMALLPGLLALVWYANSQRLAPPPAEPDVSGASPAGVLP